MPGRCPHKQATTFNGGLYYKQFWRSCPLVFENFLALTEHRRNPSHKTSSLEPAEWFLK
jgi:hypothetical protein